MGATKSKIKGGQQVYKSTFFTVGDKHIIHIQSCYDPESNPQYGFFIFLEKEVGPTNWKRFEVVDVVLETFKIEQEIEDRYAGFKIEDAQIFAKKLSPRTKWEF